MPAWIPLAALDLIALTLQEGISPKRHSGSRQLKRLQANLKHFVRWDTVQSLVEHRKTGWRELQQVLQSPDLSPQTRRKLLAQVYDPGKNLRETFVRASEALVGTAAAGGADAIEASYKLFLKTFMPETFTVISPKLYHRFGLDAMTTRKPKTPRKARVKK